MRNMTACHPGESRDLRTKRRRSPARRGPGSRRRDGEKRLLAKTNEERGFTLVEMMVVIVIIGLLAAVVVVNVMPAVDRATATRVTADLDRIEMALDQYRLENMRYPTAQEGIGALVPRYIRETPVDPWRNPYIYISPGPNGAPFRIASLGADGREGGDGDNADVTN